MSCHPLDESMRGAEPRRVESPLMELFKTCAECAVSDATRWDALQNRTLGDGITAGRVRWRAATGATPAGSRVRLARRGPRAPPGQTADAQTVAAKMAPSGTSAAARRDGTSPFRDRLRRGVRG